MNTVQNIWSRSSQIKERSYHASIELLTYLRTYLFLFQNTSRMHWSLCNRTFKHLKLLQKFLCILALMNIGCLWSLINLNSQKEPKFSHQTHLEFCLHEFRKLLTECRISRTKHDIININLDN